MGGTAYGDVWNSTDGINWNLVTPNAAFGPRFGQTTVVFDDGTGPKMWLIGGDVNGMSVNDIWDSADGITWTQPTLSVVFSPREEHSCVVFEGRLYMIGGVKISHPPNAPQVEADVWMSSNGFAWTQLSAKASFGARYGHTSLVYNNRLWVMDGRGTSPTNDLSDVWYSSEGLIWTKAAAPTFSNRDSFASVVFRDKMWAIGGNSLVNNVNTPQSDVWYSAALPALLSATPTPTNPPGLANLRLHSSSKVEITVTPTSSPTQTPSPTLTPGTGIIQNVVVGPNVTDGREPIKFFLKLNSPARTGVGYLCFDRRTGLWGEDRRNWGAKYLGLGGPKPSPPGSGQRPLHLPFAGGKWCRPGKTLLGRL